MKITTAFCDCAAAITGGLTFFGGMVAGPAGFAVGGTAGGVGSMVASHSKVQSAVKSVANKCYEHKNAALALQGCTMLVRLTVAFCTNIQNAVRNLDFKEAIMEFIAIFWKEASSQRMLC